MINTSDIQTPRPTDEARFREVTGLSLADIYSSKSYNPKNAKNPHIGLRNGLIFHINKLVKDRFTAEEIADEVLTKVIFEKLEMYNPEVAKFPTWVFQIGWHEALLYIKNNRLRKSDTQKFVSLNQEHNGTTFAEYLSDGETSDAISTEERDRDNTLRYEIVKNAIFEVDERKGAALAMRLLDGLMYKENTEFTGENENTIKSRIKQGKIAVRKATEEQIKKLAAMS